MNDPHSFLENFALVLCVAGITTVLFQRLRQPVVFGYLLAGMIVGPHLPVPLIADREMIEMLASLGVILLMFYLGLEFSLRRVMRIGGSAGLIALLETSLMGWFGFLGAQMFGMTLRESIFAAGAVAISSTTIIIKSLEEAAEQLPHRAGAERRRIQQHRASGEERRVRGKFVELVFGILLVEDLIAITLLAMLTAIAAGGSVSTSGLALTTVRLAAFLFALIGVGLLIVPRFVRWVARFARPETLLITSLGICFACSLLALSLGYSVALGAFIAGSLVAESGAVKAVRRLVEPVRDLFAAVFFVAIGMTIDPALIVRYWPIALVFTLIVLVGKFVAVSIAAFLSGSDARTSIQTGLTLAQIGEFSFIIAALGLESGVTREMFFAVVVAVSAVTTLTTPLFIRLGAPLAAYIDRKLPRPLQTFAALYTSWVERLRTAPAGETERSRLRATVRVLLLDAVILGVVIVGGALYMDGSRAFLMEKFALSSAAALTLLVVAGAAVAAPLLYGLVRSAGILGTALAMRAFPAPARGLDYSNAPRRALSLALQTGVLLLVSAPLVAVTQPFIPAFRGAVVPGVVLAILLAVFWRSAKGLQGHAHAGAEALLTLLAGPQRPGITMEIPAAQTLHGLLPGLGEPVAITIGPDTFARDHTLGDIELRGVTGATVLAIRRGDEKLVGPAGKEVLKEGDVLAIAGTHDAIEAATALLETGTWQIPGMDRTAQVDGSPEVHRRSEAEQNQG